MWAGAMMTRDEVENDGPQRHRETFETEEEARAWKQQREDFDNSICCIQPWSIWEVQS